MRESMYWFAALNLIHLLGLLIAAGTIVFWDLRLLGIGLRRAPVSEVGKSLRPWTWGGFAANVPQRLATSDHRSLPPLQQRLFPHQNSGLLLAALERTHLPPDHLSQRDESDRAPTTPLQARIAGTLSSLLWFCIMAAGRAIGYTLDYAV